jgi:hypothetical protein
MCGKGHRICEVTYVQVLFSIVPAAMNQGRPVSAIV